MSERIEKNLLNRASTDPTNLNINSTAIKLASGFLIANTAESASCFFEQKMHTAIKNGVMLELLRQILTQPQDFFQDQPPMTLVPKIEAAGQNISRLISSSSVLTGSMLNLLINFIKSPQKKELSAWIALSLCFSALEMKYLRSNYDFTGMYNKTISQMGDSLCNIKSVRFFNGQEEELNRLKEILDSKATMSAKFRNQITTKIFSQLFLLGLYQAYCTWSALHAAGSNQQKIISAFNNSSYIFPVVNSLFSIPDSLSEIHKNYKELQDNLAVLMQGSTIVDIPNAPDLKTLQGQIIFDKVHFKYQRGNFAFSNDDKIEIKPCEKVGLVGKSGCGKTTFANLLLRLFDINSGQILIDGQNIAKVTQKSLRNSIAIVSQETSLFNRSIMENIRYGKQSASDEEVIKSAKKAQIHDFIMTLPQAYNTIVGPSGVTLSGGQAQRISIARAFLKDAPILILDEATSALDSVTEKLIQSALTLLMKNRTTLIIAHRYSTLSEVDRIFLFQDGKIVEQGSPKKLLKTTSKFKELWDAQEKFAK